MIGDYPTDAPPAPQYRESREWYELSGVQALEKQTKIRRSDAENRVRGGRRWLVNG
jgi:hypothetical protein